MTSAGVARDGVTRKVAIASQRGSGGARTGGRQWPGRAMGRAVGATGATVLGRAAGRASVGGVTSATTIAWLRQKSHRRGRVGFLPAAPSGSQTIPAAVQTGMPGPGGAVPAAMASPGTTACRTSIPIAAQATIRRCR